VKELLPNATFSGSSLETACRFIAAHTAAKMRKNRHSVFWLGDKVQVKWTPYDLSKGRDQLRVGLK